MWKHVWIALTIAVLASMSYAQDDSYTRIPSAADAVAVALADAKQIDQQAPEVLPFIRYLFDNRPHPEMGQARLGYAVNTALNFAGDPMIPVKVRDDVYRIHLDYHGNRDAKTIQGLSDTWNKQTDPQFYLPSDSTGVVTALKQVELKTGNDAVLDAAGKPVIIPAGTRITPTSTQVIEGVEWRQVAHDGHKGWVKSSDLRTLSDVVNVAIPAPYADVNGQLTELIAMIETPVPIISVGQFLLHGLTAIRPHGLYHEFRQFERGDDKLTDEQKFLLRFGVRIEDIDKRQIGQRVVLVRKPTSSIGIVEYFFVNSTLASKGPGFCSITRDFFAGQIAADKHALENLGDRKHDGSEIIASRRDGGLDYLLTNGDGGRVDEAPPNLAADRTIPAPFLPRLQPAIGCISCHGKEGMWLSAANYVSWLRKVKVGDKRFDVLADRNDAGRELQKLVDAYDGETDEAFALARITHGRFSVKATGLSPILKDENGTSVPRPVTEAATAALMDEFNWWHYRYWTTQDVLMLLGYKANDGVDPADVFNEICPPLVVEPLRITSLRARREDLAGNVNPMKLTLFDVNDIFPEVATRVHNATAQQPQAEEVDP